MTHDHGQAVPDDRRRLTIAFALTATVMVAQAIGAVLTGSLALLVDTAHMLTDTVGLAMALFAAHLVRRPATARRTWGLRRAEVLAAMAQSAVLLVIGIYVLIEAVRRLTAPPEIPSTELVVFGLIGLAANIGSLLVLAGRRSASFNLRAAFLEVMNDALGSVGVIVAAVVIATTGWQRADAVAGLLIGVLIVPRAAKLLRETGAVLLESTPPGLDLDAVRDHLSRMEHVRGVHDLHASLIATGLPVITAHVVVDDSCFTDGHTARILDQLQQCVAEHFELSVEHSTFQIEPVAHQDHEHVQHV